MILKPEQKTFRIWRKNCNLKRYVPRAETIVVSWNLTSVSTALVDRGRHSGRQHCIGRRVRDFQPGCFDMADSVLRNRSEPFRSRDFSPWPFRARDISVRLWNLALSLCTLFNANVLKSTKGLFKKLQTWSKIQQLISINIWFSLSSARKLNHYRHFQSTANTSSSQLQFRFHRNNDSSKWSWCNTS